MHYKIEEIQAGNKHFHNKAVEAFEVYGRLEVTYQNNTWSFKEVLFQEPYIKSYDLEVIKLDHYISSSDRTILYAINKDCVIGQIAIRKNWNKFCYIDDLAVKASERHKGIASSLIDHAQDWAQKNNLKGFMLETQDVNLAACRLYIKKGFVLGSLDTMLYNNFDSKGERALIWYKIF